MSCKVAAPIFANQAQAAMSIFPEPASVMIHHRNLQADVLLSR